MRHEAGAVVLDPYAEIVVSRNRWGQLGRDLNFGSDSVLGMARTWPQSAAALPNPHEPQFQWGGDSPLNTPIEELIIYEAHVRGFTADPASNVSAPGTYQVLVLTLNQRFHTACFVASIPFRLPHLTRVCQYTVAPLIIQFR